MVHGICIFIVPLYTSPVHNYRISFEGSEIRIWVHLLRVRTLASRQKIRVDLRLNI